MRGAPAQRSCQEVFARWSQDGNVGCRTRHGSPHTLSHGARLRCAYLAVLPAQCGNSGHSHSRPAIRYGRSIRGSARFINNEWQVFRAHSLHARPPTGIENATFGRLTSRPQSTSHRQGGDDLVRGKVSFTASSLTGTKLHGGSCPTLTVRRYACFVVHDVTKAARHRSTFPAVSQGRAVLARLGDGKVRPEPGTI